MSEVKKLSLKNKYKIDSIQERHIEQMVAEESDILREKLYEAFSKTVTGTQRVITAECSVAIQES